MAEGDEAARRQQPQQGLRRRRQTSDSSVGVNHVSSTTSLGTGRRGRGHGGPGVGEAAAVRAGGHRSPAGVEDRGWLGSARLWPPRPPVRSHARSQGLAAAAPHAPPRGLRGRPAGLGSPSCRGNGQPGPLPAAAAWPPRCPPRPKGAALSRGHGAGTRGGRRAVRDRSPGGHSLPSVPDAGREGRDERDALGPAVAVDAGTAGTWLPGRRALSTHTPHTLTHPSFPMGAAVRRPGLGPGLSFSFTSPWLRQTHSHELCVDWPGLQVLAPVVRLGLGALGLRVIRFRLRVSGLKSPDPVVPGFC